MNKSGGSTKSTFIAFRVSNVSFNTLRYDQSNVDLLTTCPTCGTTFLPTESCPCPLVHPFSDALSLHIADCAKEMEMGGNLVLIEDFFGEFVYATGLRGLALKGDCLLPTVLASHSKIQHEVARSKGFRKYECNGAGDQPLEVTVLPLDYDGIVFTYSTFHAVAVAAV